MVALTVVCVVASILDNHREQYWCKYCDGSNNFIYCIPQRAVVVVTVVYCIPQSTILVKYCDGNSSYSCASYMSLYEVLV